jgi:hypothetical protein
MRAAEVSTRAAPSDGTFPDDYPLATLQREPNQAHPDVVRLTVSFGPEHAHNHPHSLITLTPTLAKQGVMTALNAARSVVDGPPSGPDVILPLLARAYRLDASAASCQRFQDVKVVLPALLEVIPELRRVPGFRSESDAPISATAELPALINKMLECEPGTPARALFVDAFCVLCTQLLMFAARGVLPIEPLMQQLFFARIAGKGAAFAEDPDFARSHVFLLGKLAAALPAWKRPISLNGQTISPGPRVFLLQREVLEEAVALEANGASRGELLWQLGASLHLALGAHGGGGGGGGGGGAAPERATCVARARDALLGATRLLAPGSANLRNCYLRLACLVVTAAGGDATAERVAGRVGRASVAHAGCALSGAEARLFCHWLGKARDARAALLAAHAARWPSGDRPENEDFYARLHAHEKGFEKSGVCAHTACGRAGAALRCSRCDTIYCAPQCQRAAWPAHKGVCALLGRAGAQLREQGEFGGREALDEDVRAFLGAQGGRLQERAPAREVD